MEFASSPEENLEFEKQPLVAGPAGDDSLDLIDDISYASFLVVDAMHGQIRTEYPETKGALKLWRWHRKFDPVLWLILILFNGLTLYEMPLWCDHDKCAAPDGSNLYMSGKLAPCGWAPGSHTGLASMGAVRLLI